MSEHLSLAFHARITGKVRHKADTGVLLDLAVGGGVERLGLVALEPLLRDIDHDLVGGVRGTRAGTASS